MRSHMGPCILAAAILVVGALAFGVQAPSLWTLALVAACPLMMIFMMRGMHGEGNDDAGRLKDDERDAGVRRR